MFKTPSQYGFNLMSLPQSQPTQRGAGINPMMGMAPQQKNPLQELMDKQALQQMMGSTGGNPLNGAMPQPPAPQNASPQMDQVARANMEQEQPGSSFQGVLDGLQQQPDWLQRNFGMNMSGGGLGGMFSGLFGG